MRRKKRNNVLTLGDERWKSIISRLVAKRYSFSKYLNQIFGICVCRWNRQDFANELVYWIRLSSDNFFWFFGQCIEVSISAVFSNIQKQCKDYLVGVCGRLVELVYTTDLYNLSALAETLEVELLKFEETLTGHADGNLEPSAARWRCRDLTGSI